MPEQFWKAAHRPILIAHRGGDAAGENRENTIAAFKAAWKLGYIYGETDTVLTADGQMIAAHNRWLQKMTYKQIKAAFAADARPPLLADLLLALPKMHFFIDAKSNEAAAPLVQLLKRLKVMERVSAGTFNYERLQGMIKLMGGRRCATHFIVGRRLPLMNQRLNMLKAGNLENVDFIHLHRSYVKAPLVELLQAQDMKVLAWTPNSRSAIKRAVKNGADGIISDHLKLLKTVVDEA